MGDDASVQARPRLSPAVPIGPGGGAPLGGLAGLDKKASPPALGAIQRYPRPRGDGGTAATPFSATPPGTALVRKKSHHPELRADAGPPSERREVVVLAREGGAPGHAAGLGHKMELIHLNRTCTSVNLASHAALGALSPRLRCSSHTNLTDEEKMHRVRHQVSFAQDVGQACSPAGSHAAACEDLASALRRRALQRDAAVEDSDQDDDQSSVNTDELDEDAFLDGSTKFSPDGDVDYLAVRPSLASTQLNEVRGPN